MSMERVISQVELARHNSEDSCWVVLYGRVWDVTKFIPSHPGGRQAILNLAGRDATEEYDPIHPPDQISTGTPDAAEPISDRDIAQPMTHFLNLDDLEAAAISKVSDRAVAYYASASDDQISKEMNKTAWKSILLRPRVFIDCTKCSTTTTFLGHRVGTPLFVSPAAMARLAHPDGELGIAQACARFGALQIISCNASTSPEQIVGNASPGQIFGWQMYVQEDQKKTEKVLQRVNKLSSHIKAIVLTLDAPVPGKREDDQRLSLKQTSTSKAVDRAKLSIPPGGVGQLLSRGTAADLEWEPTLRWLAQHTQIPIILKGIQSHEDAHLASQYAPQVQAIIVSNHGGRAVDTAPPTVFTLLEIRRFCPEVFEKMEVWVDGGIRRGTDVVKALCLGAQGVGVGRAPLWGLGAGGAAGVERMFEILQGEIDTCLRLLGVQSLSQLSMKHVNINMLRDRIYDGNSLEVLGEHWEPFKARL